MTVNQPRNHHSSLAIEFLHFSAVGSEPGIAKHRTLWPCGNNLSSGAKHRRILYYTNLFERSTTPRRSFTAQRKKLADVG
jgi:hypothetical protein